MIASNPELSEQIQSMFNTFFTEPNSFNIVSFNLNSFNKNMQCLFSF